jgi:hypothetical protein
MVCKTLKAAFLPVLVILLVYLSGCTMYMAVAFKHSEAEGVGGGDGASLSDDPRGVTTSATQVTLAWDPAPSSVATYKVFFRIHDTSTWYSLTDTLTADPAPQYTVQHSDVDNGIFDFGVVAVNAESAASRMHMSVETTAQPDTGWFLVWED